MRCRAWWDEQLDEYAVAKLAAARLTGGAKEAAKEELLEALRAISRTARVLPPSTPGMAAILFRTRAPRNDCGLRTAGRLVAREVETMAAAFITHGLPPTFITDLRERVDRFESLIQQRDVEKTDHVIALGQIRTALASGLAAGSASAPRAPASASSMS